SMAASTKDGFSSFDFSYSSLDLSPATAEVERIEAYLRRNNVTSISFGDLKAIIDNIKNNYNSVAAKLDEAKSTADSIGGDIDGLSANINSDKPSIDSLKVSSDNIISSINTVKITNVESIVSPLRTTIKPLTMKKNYLVYTFPTLLVLLIMFVAILMSSTSIMREKKSMAYFRNFITPTFDGMFILGQFLTDISMIMLQLLIIMGVASIFIPGLGWQLYLMAGSILLLLATIFIFIGLFLGYIFNSEESATTASISVGLVFLLFSNTIMPLESLSGFLRHIVMYNPFVVGVEILKRLVLFESNTSVIHNLLYILLVWAVVVVILATMGSYIAKRKSR
ncbi:MAG: ABC transporter permease, partial [Nanoarchaeota archaeon]